MGTFLLSTGYADKYYWQAQKVRSLFVQDFATAFTDCDLIACPTSPTFAKTIQPASNSATTTDAIIGELEDIFTEPSAICGLPSASLPCYRDPQTNLYLGLNLIAPMHAEDLIFATAYAYENGTNHNSWLATLESHHV